jgi:hypothetical protein
MQAFAIRADASSAATPRAKLQGAASLSRRGASYAYQLMREHRAAIETVKRNASRSRRRAERQQRKRRRRISCFSQALFQDRDTQVARLDALRDAKFENVYDLFDRCAQLER